MTLKEILSLSLTNVVQIVLHQIPTNRKYSIGKIMKFFLMKVGVIWFIIYLQAEDLVSVIIN